MYDTLAIVLFESVLLLLLREHLKTCVGARKRAKLKSRLYGI